MPELCRFYGIVIRMFYADHEPPHFHAEYGSDAVVIDIRSTGVIGGRLPPRALGMVIEWATIHQRELLDAWEHARGHLPPGRIDPLA
ncbi:MAG TPA: DUF4160 domain-containing protein [Phycisphaerae bacterium]|nr:DUF4160 domain-containing protein [Phycisphaerae bacterium]